MGPETPFPSFQLEYTTGAVVYIDGHNIKTLGLADLRRATAILFQDYIHFPLCIRDNIALGNSPLARDDASIEEATSGRSVRIGRTTPGWL
ncbi:hypothetical protein EDB83DRAFT_2513268 [Lactarius deliciosus]|nr:hypothetical protein EDB83DRAFT_2513268 [Lactarius deliciosus]